MSDFDFDDLAVKADNTIDLSLPQLARHGHTPVLLVSPGTEENKAFFNAVLRSEKARVRARHGGSTTETVRQYREEDSRLLAQLVIKGWKGVVDKNGTIVAFSTEECLRWLLAVLKAAPDVWLEISAFCQDRSNFRNDAIDAEGAAKNS